MTFHFSWQRRPNTVGLDDRVAVLEDGRGGCVEVWPALGFNAYRWAAPTAAGPIEVLYTSENFFHESRPTRGGIPILFPFPNRIRDGTFTWQGKTYHLPKNDPSGKNAIHGFACRHPWRVVDSGTDADSAWVTGEFRASVDGPADLALWPADYRLRVTYRLLNQRLRVEAVVENPDTKPLPFGLGYHPYFALAPFGGEEAMVSAIARQYWELVDNLPTGRLLPVSDSRDLRKRRRVAELVIDDALRPPPDDLECRGIGSVGAVSGIPAVWVFAGAEFREVVVFTPPHRQAFCIEPYSCTTDAINLEQQAIDAGWQLLAPGGRWGADFYLDLWDHPREG